MMQKKKLWWLGRRDRDLSSLRKKEKERGALGGENKKNKLRRGFVLPEWDDSM